MSEKEQMRTKSLEYELSDCKALNKALMVLAGEVSCVLDEIVDTSESEDVGTIMGEEAGKRIGKKTKNRFGLIKDIEEAFDTLIHQTDSWYGYTIEIDHIEDGTIYINVIKCFIRDILRDRGLTTGTPLCGITRGYIKGALKELTGKDVDVALVLGDVNGVCKEKIVVK